MRAPFQKNFYVIVLVARNVPIHIYTESAKSSETAHQKPPEKNEARMLSHNS